MSALIYYAFTFVYRTADIYLGTIEAATEGRDSSCWVHKTEWHRTIWHKFRYLQGICPKQFKATYANNDDSFLPKHFQQPKTTKIKQNK